MKVNAEDYKRVYFFCVGLMLAWLPFFHVVKSYPAIVFVMVWLGLTAFNEINFKRPTKTEWIFLLLPVLTVLMGFGVSYSIGDQYAFRDIEKYFGFCFPLLLLVGPRIKTCQLDEVFKIFSIGLIVASIVCLVSASYRCFNDGLFYETYGELGYKNWYFFHTSLTEILGLHPSYLSLLIVLAVLYIVYRRERLTLMDKITVGYFLFFNLFLVSRTVLFFFIVCIFLIKIDPLKGRKRIVLISGFILLFFSFFYLFKLEGFKKRFSELSSTSFNYSARHHTEWNTLTVRMAIWVTAFEVIQERPIFGYGLLGQNYLLQEYKKKDFLYAQEAGYNTHNQYLGWMLNFGVIGLLLLLLWLFYPILRRRGNKRYSFAFVLLILGVFLVENYFHRAVGIISISFIHTLISLETHAE